MYEDVQTRAIRLHAAVWEGELRQCPVWTAFGKYPPPPPFFFTLRGTRWPGLLANKPLSSPVTHQSQSPTWIVRRPRRRIWLKDVQLYVFCQPYRHENMRQNKSGAFEINFWTDEGTRISISLTGYLSTYLTYLASPFPSPTRYWLLIGDNRCG